ncbi:MAG TPA: chemotaxis protein CheW [Bacillaceae bacterium]
MPASVILNAGNEEYAIPISFITSIEKMEIQKETSHLGSAMRGMADYRGGKIPVLDLEAILFGRKTADDANSKAAVIQTGRLVFALLAKEAKDVVDIPEEAMKPLGLAATQKTKYMSAIASLGDRMITVLNPEYLLDVLDEADEIVAFAESERQNA